MLVVPSVIPTKVEIQAHHPPDTVFNGMTDSVRHLDSRVRVNDEQCSELYSAIVQLSIILHADGSLAMLDF